MKESLVEQSIPKYLSMVPLRNKCLNLLVKSYFVALKKQSPCHLPRESRGIPLKDMIVRRNREIDSFRIALCAMELTTYLRFRYKGVR